MPHIQSQDASLYYEEHGTGVPLLFVHEMAGDYRSWEPQIAHFSALGYRCITYSARGYPPSSIPDGVESYSQAQAAADALAVLDALGIDKAHVVGLSMGSFATLQFGMDYPGRALSLTAVGCGSGAEPQTYRQNQARYAAMGDAILDGGWDAFVKAYSEGPYRQPFMRKSPQAWASFRQRLAEHSALGTAMTLKGVQGGRPSVYALSDALSRIDCPALIVCGDLDLPCVDPSVFLYRAIPGARLAILPDTGHTVNLEEPDLFNAMLATHLKR